MSANNQSGRVTDTEIARMVALRGLGFTQREIADRVGRNPNTVQRKLAAVEDRAREATAPLTVFGTQMEALLDVSVTVTADAGSHQTVPEPQEGDA